MGGFSEKLAASIQSAPLPDPEVENEGFKVDLWPEGIYAGVVADYADGLVPAGYEEDTAQQMYVELTAHHRDGRTKTLRRYMAYLHPKQGWQRWSRLLIRQLQDATGGRMPDDWVGKKVLVELKEPKEKTRVFNGRTYEQDNDVAGFRAMPRQAARNERADVVVPGFDSVPAETFDPDPDDDQPF